MLLDLDRPFLKCAVYSVRKWSIFIAILYFKIKASRYQNRVLNSLLQYVQYFTSHTVYMIAGMTWWLRYWLTTPESRVRSHATLCNLQLLFGGIKEIGYFKNYIELLTLIRQLRILKIWLSLSHKCMCKRDGIV